MPVKFKPYPFDFVKRRSGPRNEGELERHEVVIAGGGVAGLTAALALAAQGIASVVIEADDSVCFGSRAICISRRSLEIFERLGAADEILEKGLPWTGGRSFHRTEEVLRFTMPDDANQHLPPMVNIQQYYLEEYLVRALERHADLVDIRWQSRIEAVAPEGDAVMLEVRNADDRYTIRTDWLVACDGGRSTVREALGLHLQGTAYEGIYIIADIHLESSLPTERLAWFDPPSNPGSTILMHRQPDDIWRIDYQIRADEHPETAVLPENVLPRIRAHLEMMGEKGEWAPIWISLYKANALTLRDYRHGRVFFAGDAAHLVPIFGVRGANSAIDDVDNLAWKLAAVIKGAAGDALLDTYSPERVFAARENLRQGMKSTEFMAPPTFAFQGMREAVLSLAASTPGVRPLINPRQTSAIHYLDSPALAQGDDDGLFSHGPARGAVLQDVPLRLVRAAERPPDAAGHAPTVHLTQLVRPGEYLLLVFGDDPGVCREFAHTAERLAGAGVAVRTLAVCPRAFDGGMGDYLLDDGGKGAALYGAGDGAAYLVRPDGHVFGRWRRLTGAALMDAMRSLTGMAQPGDCHE